MPVNSKLANGIKSILTLAGVGANLNMSLAGTGFAQQLANDDQASPDIDEIIVADIQEGDYSTDRTSLAKVIGSIPE